MILFKDIPNEEPYRRLYDEYNQALAAKQQLVQAINISSYSVSNLEVDSRFVNLKEVRKDEFIFFTNFNSPKAMQFRSHSQIAATLFWYKTNTQIRMKANINKKSKEFNKNYFLKRSSEKNALAISSKQSNVIHSFDAIKEKYLHSLKNEDLSDCPEYWGGFGFKPYQIEFWKGNEYRLNKRELFVLNEGEWKKYILEP